MEPISLRDFLETVPPSTERQIANLLRDKVHGGGTRELVLPRITLHCAHADCGGRRTYKCLDETITVGITTNFGDHFLTYTCQNCRSSWKKFSVRFNYMHSAVSKYGESPNFGPPTPSRAIKLIGSDRELFLQGRRCEIQGLGIGAFTYYRRVIEDQKSRIFDEVIRVLETIDPQSAAIDEIRKAKDETQFSKSVEKIKHALPASLLINGKNPLRLLHGALSEGVHNLSDEQCLALATAVRTVLFEFSERLGQALKDDAELSSAVSLLANPRASLEKLK